MSTRPQRPAKIAERAVIAEFLAAATPALVARLAELPPATWDELCAVVLGRSPVSWERWHLGGRLESLRDCVALWDRARACRVYASRAVVEQLIRAGRVVITEHPTLAAIIPPEQRIELGLNREYLRPAAKPRLMRQKG